MLKCIDFLHIFCTKPVFNVEILCNLALIIRFRHLCTLCIVENKSDGETFL